MLAVKTNQKLVQLLLRSRKNCIEAFSFEISIIRPEFVLEKPHKLFHLSCKVRKISDMFIDIVYYIAYDIDIDLYNIVYIVYDIVYNIVYDIN